MMNGIERDLERLRIALANFFISLKEEASALGEPRIDDLGKLVETKNQQTQALNEAWAALMAHFSGTPHTPESLDREISAHPELRDKWRQVRQLARAADQLNRENGSLIEAMQRRTHLALEILHSAANRRGLYGSDGQMVDYLTSQRTLDKA